MSTYLAWAFWGLLALLALLWIIELTFNRRRVFDSLRAVFQSGAARMRLMRLSSERTNLEKQLAQASAGLGKSAWEQQVVHPAYVSLFEQLGDLFQQRTQLRSSLGALDAQIQQESISYTQFKAEHTARIAPIQEQRQAAAARLNQSRAAAQASEKQIGQIQAQQRKASGEIQELRRRMDQLRTSSAADRDAQLSTLASGIAALEQTLAGLSAPESAVQAELARLQAEQPPLVANVTSLEQQIAQLQAEQQQALTPLESQREALQAQRREINDQVGACSARIEAMLGDLGTQVYLARPSNPAISSAYAQIDQIQQQIASIDSQSDLLKARQAGIDRRTPRTFALLLVALLGSVGAVVLAINVQPGLPQAPGATGAPGFGLPGLPGGTPVPVPTPAPPPQLTPFAETVGDVFQLDIPAGLSEIHILTDVPGFAYGFWDTSKTHDILLHFQQVDETWEQSVDRIVQQELATLEGGAEVGRQLGADGPTQTARVELASNHSGAYRTIWLKRVDTMLVSYVASLTATEWPAWQPSLEQSFASLKWNTLKMDKLVAIPAAAQEGIEYRHMTLDQQSLAECACLPGDDFNWVLSPAGESDIMSAFLMMAFNFDRQGYVTIAVYGAKKATGTYEVHDNYIWWNMKDYYQGANIDFSGSTVFKAYLFTDDEGGKWIYMYDPGKDSSFWLSQVD